MRIEPADDPTSFDDVVRLMVERHPHTSRADAGWPFEEVEHVSHLSVLVARDRDESLAGALRVVRASFLPPGWAMVSTTVATAHEGTGVGRALWAAAGSSWPDDTTELRATVYDDDPRSLAIARHHGFEVQTHGITSELSLVDLPAPAPPDDVTLDDVPDFDFADRDAVARMLAASQTHPEALNGAVMTLDQLASPPSTAVSVAVLARVDGVPAGIVCGLVRDADFHIHYTGVDPRCRGRGLARLLKQRAHLLAAEAGATSTRTTNEVTNTGIRSLNAELGYAVRFGAYRLRLAL